jgi:SAM-dependent methyltransferase
VADERVRPVPAEARPPRPTYGIDAPGVVLTFTVLGVVTFFGATFAAAGNSVGLVVFFLVAMVITGGTAASMVWTSVKGKPRMCAQRLDALHLRGDERSLDVGCGRGLVLVETARRLPSGRAVGVDVWRSKDQSGNHRSVTEANAAAAGVADRVEVRDADMRELPFPDESFDLVTASLAVHNIAEAAGREQAVSEMARVLAPGGRILIVDIARTNEYVQVLRDAGLDDVQRSGPAFAVYPPVRTVSATRVPSPAATDEERSSP